MGMSLWKVSQIAKENFALGAASRDEEVSEWQTAYEKAAEAALVLSQESDRLRDLLRPFAALLQEHNCDGPDEQPVFQINGAKITKGDLRSAFMAANNPPK